MRIYIKQPADSCYPTHTWLISRESDFVLGKELHLLLDGLNWEHWINFQNGFFEKIDAESLVQVSKRYQYGGTEIDSSQSNI